MDAATLTMEIPAQAATASFEAFFEESCQRIVGIVAVATGDVAAAEDAVQDAYARALTHWGRVSNYDRPDLWVARVATRLAIDAWRKRRRETALESGMRASVDDDIDRLWVRWGLEGLSPMQRMTVILRHVEGRPVVEVAAAVSTSPETVKTHLKRATRRLRQLLGDTPR
ncbi:MAG TPA: sigma-70 family RNA polymerase sigma factor [Candidatus Dormibacteraeota bacterium]|nr:sigma-70 family RNA polymerase sigma factor [Candidatus Dormibacteraeota bacterium]